MIFREKKTEKISRSISSGHEKFSVANIMPGDMPWHKTFISGVFCMLGNVFGHPSVVICWGSGNEFSEN